MTLYCQLNVTHPFLALINSSSQIIFSLLHSPFFEFPLCRAFICVLIPQSRIPFFPRAQSKFSTSFFYFSLFFQFLEFKMGYTYLLNTEASLATFRQRFNIPDDMDVAYCYESEITFHRRANTSFFLLMAILEGGVRFPVDPLLLNTLRFYRLCPD